MTEKSIEKRELKTRADLDALINERPKEIYIILRDFLKKKGIKSPSEELLQDMMVGFLEYSKSFDEVYKVRPLTYLYKCLDGILKRRGKTNSLIKPSMAYHAKILEAVRLYKEKHSTENISILEIAQEVGCSVEAVERSIGYIHSVDSFSTAGTDQNPWDFVDSPDIIEDRTHIDDVQGEDFIDSLLSTLSVEEAYIVKSRVKIFPHKSLQELGEQFELSKERVRQIEEEAIHKLRQALINDVEGLDKAKLLRLILNKELNIKPKKQNDSSDSDN